MNFRRINSAWIIALHDVIMVLASFYIALYLRLDKNFSNADPILLPGGLILFGTTILVFLTHGIHRRVWRYASFNDLLTITRAVTFTVLFFALALFLFNRLEGMPRSAFLIQWGVTMLLIGGPRFLYRAITRKHLIPRWGTFKLNTGIPVLIAGITDESEMFMRNAAQQSGGVFRIVAAADTRLKNVGRYVYNVKVMGLVADLEKILEKLKHRQNPVQKIIFSPDLLKLPGMAETIQRLDAAGYSVAQLPRVSELNNTMTQQASIQPIAVEDLLGRPQKTHDKAAVSGILRGKRVMITGAGGSIGSELVRQIAGFEPASLLLFDISEHNLYSIHHHLESQLPSLTTVPVLGDIQDEQLLNAVCSGYKPEIIFHAAAMKHVPMSEMNVEQAVLTNIIGTRNVAEAAQAVGAAQMIMISTDKAVHPTNIMGASKRLAELYVQALAQQPQKGKSRTRYSTVRFGNVLGSSGSVVPLFRRQLEAGGPLTVTHPDITRFFMTIREAVELVLQAAVLASQSTTDSQSNLYVLDMGKSMKIKELAEQMIRLAGLVPHKDIEIRYTGLRAGEKMYEELFYDFEQPQRGAPGEHILLTRAIDYNFSKLLKSIATLEKLARTQQQDKLRLSLQQLVQDYAGPARATA